VLYDHLTAPFELKAYSRLAMEPTYTVPSEPMAGEL